MKRPIVVSLLALAVTLAVSTQANAFVGSLKIQPLQYNEAIVKGEKKKGFVDISNPTSLSVTLTTSVQAFRQIDDNGGLEFYDNEQVSAGIVPDLAEFELGPREAIRMYFLIDGTKLPEGDVFGALFVATKANQESKGIAQSVKLGTLFTLVNGTPGARDATIESLTASFFQYGTAVKGSYKVKNTADPKETTGFYPEVAISLSPLTSTFTSKSPLAMAGRTREATFTLDGNRFGFYTLKATHGDSSKSKLVFAMTGFWLWLAPLLIVGFVALVYGLKKGRKKRYYKAT